MKWWMGMLLVAVQCILGPVSALMEFEMFPKYDQFILVGTRFELNCTMKQPEDDAEDYEVTKTMILKGTQELPSDVQFKFYQEDRTLAVTIPNVTLEHDGIYMCYYGNDTDFQSLKPVHVGEPPGKPENITCVSNNLNDFRCSFSPSKKPTNIPMRWRMEYRLSDDFSHSVNCSNTSDLVILCEPWSVVIQFVSYEILINGVNDDFELQVNGSSTVKLNQSIVRPDPVAYLSVEHTNVSSETELLWGFPKGLPRKIFRMQYRIVITSDWDNRTLDKEGNKKHEEYLLTQLIPYTSYRVTVQAKPMAAVGDIYWSNKNVLDFWTESDVCEHTVSMTNGSYMVVDCEHHDEHVMCVVLYWKNPARKDWNGNITGYRVIVQKVNLAEYTVAIANNREERNSEDQPIYRFRRVTKPWTENVTGIAVSGVLKTTLYKTDNYSMRMMVINTAGISMNSIEIVIPNWDKGKTLKTEWVSVEIASSSVHISWYMDRENCDAVRSVTYYWGLADTNTSVMNKYTVYKEEFDWLTVGINDGCGIQTSQIEKFLYQSNARYAVSVGTGQISGGMMLETFRFKKHDDVAVMPQYTVSADSERLQVHILYSDYYISEGGRPEQYQIVYSESSESDDCPLDGYKSTFPANFTNPVFEINDPNLKSGTQYKVCVAAINTAGTGRYGEPVITRTPEDDSALITVMVIVIPVTMIVFGLCVILLCCNCYRRFQRYKVENQTITLQFPDEMRMDGTYREKTNVTKLSDEHDSGKGSDSPASSSSEIVDLQQDGVRVSPKTSSSKESTLSGYLNVVQGNSSNSVYVVDCLGHESDSLIDGEDISSEKYEVLQNRRKQRTYNTIDGDLTCSSNSDKDLHVTKAATNTNASSAACTVQVPIVGRMEGSREPLNEHVDDTQMLRNINNTLVNAPVPQSNEYLPNNNDQEIHRFIAGVTRLSQKTSNTNLVYVDEHDTRKILTNVKACVLNDVEQLPKRFPKQSHKQAINQNSIVDDIEQEAIDTTDDALQSYASHDYQTHQNCKVKADEDIISDYIEAVPSDVLDTSEYNGEITSEDTEEPAVQCPVITDFEKNPSTGEILEGNVNTEYNGSSVNAVNRCFQGSTSSDNDVDIFSNTFDNLIENSCIGHYRRPDEISLGQGSTVSDVSDTTSIKSSEFMDGRRSGTLSPDEVSLIETPVFEICKEIQDFVEVVDVVEEGNGNKMEVERSVENDKKIEENFRHTEVCDHIGKSMVKCSVELGDTAHGESFSSGNRKNTSGTGNVESYMKTGLESTTDGIQEFNRQNTGITDRKAKKDTSLKTSSPEHALDSNVIRNDIQMTPL